MDEVKAKEYERIAAITRRMLKETVPESEWPTDLRNYEQELQRRECKKAMEDLWAQQDEEDTPAQT